MSEKKSLWERKPEGFPKGNGLTQGPSSCDPAQKLGESMLRSAPTPGRNRQHTMQRWPRTPISWVWLTSGEIGVKLSVSTHIGLNQPTSWLFMKWVCLFMPLVHWKWHYFVFPLPPPGHLTIVQTLLIVVSVGDTSLSPSTQDFNFIHWAAGRWPVPTAKVNTSGLLCLGE